VGERNGKRKIQIAFVLVSQCRCNWKHLHNPGSLDPPFSKIFSTDNCRPFCYRMPFRCDAMS
jgi:hypothetical protein